MNLHIPDTGSSAEIYTVIRPSQALHHVLCESMIVDIPSVAVGDNNNSRQGGCQ